MKKLFLNQIKRLILCIGFVMCLVVFKNENLKAMNYGFEINESDPRLKSLGWDEYEINTYYKDDKIIGRLTSVVGRFV